MRNLSKKERNWVICLLMFFVIALIVGIKSVYAYYSSEVPGRRMFTAYVGDFYVAKGDISVNVYKKVPADSSLGTVYKRENAIPTSGSIASVSCKVATYSGTNPTDNGAAITCTNNGTGNCSYTYSAGKITLKSSQPVRCKFYFN